MLEIGPRFKSRIRQTKSWYRCECGDLFECNIWDAKAGHTKSCGCRRVTKPRNHKHGMTGTRTFRIWCGVKSRVSHPSHTSYRDYGGRGIKICERWEEFSNFLVDMGECPSNKHSIDRIDCNGNYEPDNCRWSTAKEQANNKRSTIYLTLEGETKPLRYWCEELGLKPATVRARLRRGWDHEKALLFRK